MDHTQEELSFLCTWMKNLGQMCQWLPRVSDVFLARFPLSVMSVLWSASSVAPAFFRPPNSVRRPREKLKTSGTQGRRDIVCVCIKSEFGRVMRPDIVVQMRDSSWRRTVYFCTSWMTNRGLCSFGNSFPPKIMRWQLVAIRISRGLLRDQEFRA